MLIYIYIYTHIHIHIYIYVDIHVYIYIYICIGNELYNITCAVYTYNISKRPPGSAGRKTPHRAKAELWSSPFSRCSSAQL